MQKLECSAFLDNSFKVVGLKYNGIYGEKL
jgi:hypothetical protein